MVSEQLLDAQNQERLAYDAHKASVLMLDDCRLNSDSFERQYGEAVAKTDECKMGLEDSRNVTLQERQRMRAEEAALNDERDEERRSQSKIEQSQRDTQGALNSLRKAEAAYRELERELERRRADVEASNAAVHECREREDQLMHECDILSRGVQDKERDLAAAGENLHRCTANEQNALQSYKDACDVMNRLRDALSKAEHDKRALTDKATAAAGHIEACSVQCKELSRQHEALERNNANFAGMRMQTAEEESDLLHEEVALRKQRVALESREARLRNRSFSSRRISASPDAKSPVAIDRSPVSERVSNIKSYTPAYGSRSPADRGYEGRESSLRSYHISPPRGGEYEGSNKGREVDREMYNTVHYTPTMSQERGRAPVEERGRASVGEGHYSSGARRSNIRSPHNTNTSSSSALSPGRFGRSGYDDGRYPRPQKTSPVVKPVPPPAVPVPSAPKYDSAEIAGYAEVLYKAMKGLGTDEEDIYETLSRMQSQGMWNDVKRAFKENHSNFDKGNLIRAMENDLSKKELEKCNGILAEMNIIM
eukprot:TRINITY_DN13795_c0_g1_i1.p1 TRINITY_DN13795_c0_g1~~TRINITY_DN13795_c0_g1_i1.p1  ORF type:complete len:541 (+),score=88.53 TRINITY_DN13795_c0_g1_i1:365-1987(+)